MNIFYYPIDTWADFIFFNFCMDRGAGHQLEDVRQCSYGPWARAIEGIFKEEKFHIRHGEFWVTKLADDPATRDEAQATLNKWYIRTMNIFGRPGSAKNAVYRKYRLKLRDNDEVRQAFADEVTEKARSVGLTRAGVEARLGPAAGRGPDPGVGFAPRDGPDPLSRRGGNPGGAVVGSALPAGGRAGRQVKVALEFQQQGQEARQGAQGRGSVVIQDGKAAAVAAAAWLVAGHDDADHPDERRLHGGPGRRHGVDDDGERGALHRRDVVPGLRDGAGLRGAGTAWQRVGTTLVVNPTILPNGQIRVRLMPQVSYFSPPRAAAASSSTRRRPRSIVPNGRAMRIGGGTRGVNQVTRQILGYREQQSSSESSFILTATMQ